PDTDVDGALVLAEKLREALMREEIPQLLQPLTASFGVATIPQHAGAAELLLRRADRACYLAKDRGRNRVQVAALDDQPDYSMPRSPGSRSNGRAASATAAATAVGTEGSKTDGTM